MALAQPKTMLQSTIHTLDQSDAQPGTGASLIKEWLSALKSENTVETAPLADKLQALYDELINPNPTAATLRKLMTDVAAQTGIVARTLTNDEAAPVLELAGMLQSFAINLDRANDDDALEANQPTETTIYDMNDSGLRASRMIQDTLDALGTGVATPEAGSRLVDDWITVVRSDVNTQWVEEPLARLRDALDAGDWRTAERTMRDLAGQTQDLANNTGDTTHRAGLSNVATTLLNFAQGLN